MTTDRHHAPLEAIGRNDTSFFRNGRGLLLLALILTLGGCASLAPEYVPSNTNIRVLQANPGNGASVSAFKNGHNKQSEELDQLTIRGGRFSSPYQGSYAAYLREALRIELQAAGRWKPGSPVVISGELLENSLDASGTSAGVARLSARFVVQSQGKILYNKVITVDHQWESSFMGAIAIPRAREQYVVTIQKVLGKLFKDVEFLTAIR